MKKSQPSCGSLVAMLQENLLLSFLVPEKLFPSLLFSFSHPHIGNTLLGFEREREREGEEEVEMLDLRHIRQGDPTGHRASAEEFFFKNYSVVFSFWSNGNGKHQEAPSSLSLSFWFPFDNCEHYKRLCKFRVPCRNQIFLCRHCHNAATICFLLLPQLVAPSDATINGSCSSYQVAGLRAMCPVDRYDCQRALHNLCWCYCWASYCWRTLGSINQLCICIGILAALVAGLPLAGNPKVWWRTMFGIAIIPSVLLALGMAFSPESPTWLYQQGKFLKLKWQ